MRHYSIKHRRITPDFATGHRFPDEWTAVAVHDTAKTHRDLLWNRFAAAELFDLPG